MSAVRFALRCSALVVLLALSACGGDEQSRYADEVDAVQEAVEAGDRDRAVEALQALQVDVTRAQQAGELEQGRFDELQMLIHESQVLVDSLLPPPTTEPAPTTQPPVEPSDDEDDKEDDKEDDEKDDEKDDEDKDDDHPGNGRGRDKD